MCYSTVGWVPPACAPPPPSHDYTDMSHIKRALSRSVAFVRAAEVPCALWLSLTGSHAPMTGSTFVSSPLTEESPSLLHHHRESTLTFALSLRLLIRKILPCMIPVQLSSLRLIVPVPSRSMIILLYRVRTDAHSARMETRSPRLHPPAIM